MDVGICGATVRLKKAATWAQVHQAHVATGPCGPGQAVINVEHARTKAHPNPHAAQPLLLIEWALCGRTRELSVSGRVKLRERGLDPGERYWPLKCSSRLNEARPLTA